MAALHECLRWELRGTGVRCLLVAPYQLETPLLRGGAPLRFGWMRPLLPPLSPAAVATAVVDATRRGRESLVLPWPLKWLLLLLPLLPRAARDAALDLGGASIAMEGFVGREAEEEGGSEAAVGAEGSRAGLAPGGRRAGGAGGEGCRVAEPATPHRRRGAVSPARPARC